MNEPKHIIISRTDSIGDVVLTLPVAGYLKNLYPNAVISFLGRTYTEEVINLSQNIDHFVNWDSIAAKDTNGRIRDFERIEADWIIHAFPDYPIAALAKRAGIKNRIGTSHRFFHWFTCNKRVHFSRKRSDLHEAQLNLKLLAPLGIIDIPGTDQVPTFFGMTRFSQPSPELYSLIDPNRFNLILHPRSKGSAREWGLENYEQLIKMLPEKDYKIFITGTQEESHTMRSFLEKTKYKAQDLTGRLSLKELILFIFLVDGLVAASTGPLHIAAAIGKRTIGLFAPIRSMHPGRWAPLGQNALALVVNKECRGCRKTHDCTCIRSISPFQVAEALNYGKSE